MTSLEAVLQNRRTSTIVVHGSPLSTATMRVLATLNEKNLIFDFNHVNMANGEQKKKPYISLNPFGQLPAFEDGDDLKLYESRAITKYIARGPYSNIGTQLIPAETKEKAYVVMWMEVEAHQFDPWASRLAFELGFKPMIRKMPDLLFVPECIDKLKKVLDIYEGRLGETKYLGGDEFSLVDVHHQPTLHYIMSIDSIPEVKQLVESRPRVKAWCQDILARPAWAKVIEMHNKYKKSMYNDDE